jgi:hypothetical protein
MRIIIMSTVLFIGRGKLIKATGTWLYRRRHWQPGSVKNLPAVTGLPSTAISESTSDRGTKSCQAPATRN